MGEGSNPMWILVLGIVLGPLLTYLVAARRLSGSIKDSEASSLWAESSSIREWSTERVRELTAHVTDLEGRMESLETKNGELLQENKQLIMEKAHLDHLLEQERSFNARLRWEAEHSPKRRQNDQHFVDGEEQAQ